MEPPGLVGIGHCPALAAGRMSPRTALTACWPAAISRAAESSLQVTDTGQETSSAVTHASADCPRPLAVLLSGVDFAGRPFVEGLKEVVPSGLTI